MEGNENSTALETTQSGEQAGVVAPEQVQDEARQSFIDSDVADFVARHPEMDGADIISLIQNPQFRQFCGSRFGTESLSALYEDYLSLVGSAGNAALERAEKRRERSTGHGGGNAAALSPEQKKALDQWNAANPEMRMTAKEFLGR